MQAVLVILGTIQCLEGNYLTRKSHSLEGKDYREGCEEEDVDETAGLEGLLCMTLLR